MFRLKQLGAAVLIAGVFSPAYAADVLSFPGITTTGNITLSSDYRFRGISQTSNNPAIQGAINFNHESGLYASVWGSNIDGKGTAEIDGVLGYASKFAIIPNVESTLDMGYIRYIYAGSGDSAPGSHQPDYNEIYAKIGFANAFMANDSLVTGINYSNDYLNHSSDFWYLNANYTAPIADTGFGVVAGLGYNVFKSSNMLNRALIASSHDDNYVDYKLGVNFGVQGLTTELAWIDNSLKHSACVDKNSCDGTLQLSMSKTF